MVVVDAGVVRVGRLWVSALCARVEHRRPLELVHAQQRPHLLDGEKVRRDAAPLAARPATAATITGTALSASTVTAARLAAQVTADARRQQLVGCGREPRDC